MGAMAKEQTSELPELIEWLSDTIGPIQGQQWQITLNSSGGVVEAKASVITSKTEKPGQSMTISHVTKVRFRLSSVPPKRIVFTTE